MDLKKFWAPYTGAVSLTFDDGSDCQLEKAIPAMNRLGLKGTFYLYPRGEGWRQRLSPWKEVANDGHEIGNHSLSHFCSNNFSGTPGGVEDKSLEEIESDMLVAQERLSEIAPHQKQWTFCYPCYCTDVGRGESRETYIPVVARHFLAGRGVGEYGFGNHPAQIDLASVWGLSVVRMSGYEMIGLVEEITSSGRWAILIFHEIDGSRLTVASHDLQMLLNYLHRRSETIWTAPVVEVARKIAQFQEA